MPQKRRKRYALSRYVFSVFITIDTYHSYVRKRTASCILGMHDINDFASSVTCCKSKYSFCRDAGDKRQQDLAEACLGHLSALRAHRTEVKKDDIFYFCMRLDCRLRALPKAKAQDIMHQLENAMYDVEKECSDLV